MDEGGATRTLSPNGFFLQTEARSPAPSSLRLRSPGPQTLLPQIQTSSVPEFPAGIDDQGWKQPRQELQDTDDCQHPHRRQSLWRHVSVLLPSLQPSVPEPPIQWGPISGPCLGSTVALSSSPSSPENLTLWFAEHHNRRNIEWGDNKAQMEKREKTFVPCKDIAHTADGRGSWPGDARHPEMTQTGPCP